jgi:hypothetical protein
MEAYTSLSKEEEVSPLTVDDLLNAGKAVLTRTIRFDMGNGEEMVKELKFRRLTYTQIAGLSKIPQDQTDKYTRSVVFEASVMPQFEDIDEVGTVPSGFVRHYSAAILEESGKDPFLSEVSSSDQ